MPLRVSALKPGLFDDYLILADIEHRKRIVAGFGSYGVEATLVLTFVAVTFAPEIDAPEASVTLPRIEVEVVCAKLAVVNMRLTRLSR